MRGLTCTHEENETKNELLLGQPGTPVIGRYGPEFCLARRREVVSVGGGV